MARILLIPMSWGRGIGPITTSVAIADILSIHGHDIAFAIKDDFRKFVEARSHGIIQIMPSLVNQPITTEYYEDFASFQGLNRPDYIEAILASESLAIKNFKPDCIISHLQLTASLSAREFHIPHIASARWTEHPNFSLSYNIINKIPEKTAISKATTYFNHQLLARSLPEVKDVWDLSYMYANSKYVVGFPELEPELKNEPDLHYIGYLQDINPRNDYIPLDSWYNDWISTGDAKIFVYFSRKDLSPKFYYPLIFDTFKETNFSIIIADPTLFFGEGITHPYDNIWVTPYVASENILAKCDLVISLGMRNTILQSLLAGVGMVLLSSKDEELVYLSDRVEQMGIGLKLDRDKVDPLTLLKATHKVLMGNYRRTSAKLGKRMRKLGGPDAIAELVNNTLNSYKSIQ